MSLAKNYIDQLHKLNKTVSGTFEGLTRMQSSIDKELSVVYHEIEREEIDVYNGYLYAKRLQEVLKRRRVVKDEIARLSSFKSTLENTVKDDDSRYERVAKKSEEVRNSLNVTMTINDIVKMDGIAL